MFYTFNQNNSGGSFDFDDERGITQYVIIEADNLDEALTIAESIGLYFDGVENDLDCPCCGDRWYKPWGADSPDEVPTLYGKPAEEYKPYRWREISKGKDIAIHYKDGTIKWL